MDRRTFLAAALAAPVAARAQVAKKKMSGPNLITPKQRLGDDLYLYVNASSGIDSNNGWSSASPKRTIQAAYDYAKSEFDFNGHGMEIHLAPTGVRYAPLKAVSSLIGYHIFNVIGDGPSPNSCIIEAPANVHCIDVQDYAAVGVMNLGLIGGENSNGINCRQHTIVDYGNVAFWGTGGIHIALSDNALASCIGNEFIYGNCSAHWSISGNSKLVMGASIVAVNSPLSFIYFLLCQNNSSFGGAHTYVGPGSGTASSGQKYQVQLNAVAQLGNQVPPGNTLPSTAVQYGGVIA